MNEGDSYYKRVPTRRLCRRCTIVGAMFAFIYDGNEFIRPLMYLPLQGTFPIRRLSFLSEQTPTIR